MFDEACGTHYFPLNGTNCTALPSNLYSNITTQAPGMPRNESLAFSDDGGNWSFDELGQMNNKMESTFQMVVELYIISVLAAFGLVGNVMSVIVLRQDRERRDALFLLQAVAVADACYLVVGVFRYPLRYLISPGADGSNHWVDMQPVVFPLLKTFQTIAIWMMVLVTVDRFTCVCLPLAAPRYFNRVTRPRYAIIVFIVGFLYNLPRFFDSCVVMMVDRCFGPIGPPLMIYRAAFNNVHYYNIYRGGLYLVFLYLGPLIILITMNCCLICAIRYSRTRHRCGESRTSSGRTWSPSTEAIASTDQTATSSSGSNVDRNATIVLVIIVAVFIVCETPELVHTLVTFVERNFLSSEIEHASHMLHLAIVSELLMIVNSSANFVVYIAFGRRFRRVMRETFRFSFRFSYAATVVTRDSPQGGVGGGGCPAYAAQQQLQYHHNCIHAPRAPQPPMALRPMLGQR